MIYLDYAANTPVDERVLEEFSRVNREFYGNPNGRYSIGYEADELILKASDKIIEHLGASGMEVIYTSGATEANNMAIKGAAAAYRENGRHIISTCLEHSSVSGALTYLQTKGYEIDLVDIDASGRVDVNHLKELMRTDTVLMSVCYVDSELGTQQPVEAIAEVVQKYPNCMLHVDATQAVGKIRITSNGIDMLSFAPHKFYGINGMGILLKRESIVLEPLLHGGNSTSIYRSGTPVPAFASATEIALRLCCEEQEERLAKVTAIKTTILNGLKKYPLVRVNSTDYALPHFINISIKGVKATAAQKLFDENGVYISPKSACSTPNTPSRAVFAVTKDRKNALYSWRITLSHLLTDAEIDDFLCIFDECYMKLTK